MATRIFSTEDGNLSNGSLTSSMTRRYKDIDLTFQNRTTGDIFKKNDAAAVKQSVKNLLLTNKYEKPFEPYYGGNLNNFLFELTTEFDETQIEENVRSAILNYEPRANVMQVVSVLQPDYNSVEVKVVFQVVSTGELVSVTVPLTSQR